MVKRANGLLHVVTPVELTSIILKGPVRDKTFSSRSLLDTLLPS